LSEPTNPISFCVYGAGPDAHFDGLGQLKAQPQRCECRRGIKELEALLDAYVAPNQLTLTDDVGRGLQKLHLRRTDLYFDVREVVTDYLSLRMCNKGWPRLAGIRELGTVLTTTAHCYLGPAQARHAPRMAQALAQLKHSGKVEAYRQQSLQLYQQRCLQSAPAL
jgi:hypothetical protein